MLKGLESLTNIDGLHGTLLEFRRISKELIECFIAKFSGGQTFAPTIDRAACGDD